MGLPYSFFIRCFRRRPTDELQRYVDQKIYNEPALAAIRQILERRSFMMSTNLYEHYKKMFHDTKPIRGRDEDVRPIGNRRRDWERIEMDGDVVACRLYQTQVVRYYPDGRVGVKCDGWGTPLTAEFIHIHSPWQCFKQYNKLWVQVRVGADDHKCYPVPTKGELVFEHVDGCWRPTEAVQISKRVIDRAKSKQAREPVKGFMKWAKSFLVMSDGWLMHETRLQVQGTSPHGWDYGTNYLSDNELYEMMSSDDPEKHMLALCVMLQFRNADEKRKVGETEAKLDGINNYAHKVTWYDTRFNYEHLRGRVDRVVKAVADVYTTVDVEVKSGAQVGVV